MSFIVQNVLIIGALFLAMLGLQATGRQLAERHRRSDPDGHGAGYSAVEGAVFGLLALFLAFTFSGAGARFDERRHLIVDEANAIGTAWLRIDLLPDDAQPEVRDLFRQYLDARLETYRLVPDMLAADAALARSQALQHRIWSKSVAAGRASGQIAPFTVLLPALNVMIDITTTRTAVTRFHPPLAVFVLLSILALVGSIFVGYSMAGRKTRSLVHTFGFATLMVLTLYLIVDFEYPRLGLIRVDAADQVLVDLRRSME